MTSIRALHASNTDTGALRGRLVWLMAAALVVALLGEQGASAGVLSLLVLTLGVALLGLPHGAFDHLTGARLIDYYLPNARHPRTCLGVFMLGYGLLSISLLWCWYHWPTLGLTVFLLLSAAHFGTDWRGQQSLICRLCWGALVIALPFVWRPDEVAGIVQKLAVPEPAPFLQAARPVVALALGIVLVGIRHRGVAFLSATGLLLLGAAVLNPLAYFVCYFCCFHSPLHLSTLRHEHGLTGRRRMLTVAAPIVLMTWLGAGAGYLWMSHDHVTGALIKTIFIGLACLTVPHMLVEWLGERIAHAPVKSA
ncbi:beta-carotene 15,15'-monooxygenase, Brp/Blh family [Kushneria avicenniae]|uniref:Probable beta-carotene 15,15'-dioxygenase n=1 Tax=Kushneria avicenniae TaxID=402385 RepID=A0A1I1LG13_9GAMM|nr:Brp/Blh family beta-carotene 15,15'-dioxygenase [Kushneria avicenniae]SFC71931.1 beta-carotene 15,15'-monooxygenase, Brp/Blh family [Kushneria avicenniae]